MIGRKPKGQVRAYGRVSRIYAPSGSVSRQITEAGAGSRTLVIGYPIEWGLLAASASRKPGPILIGYVGRIHPEKGIQLLLEAAALLAQRAELPPWRLRIVGPVDVADGGGGEPWLASLRKRHPVADSDRIEWLPAEFNQERLAEIYGSIHIFCYPSLAEMGETFGVAVAEAMAAGCAVVVSRLECFSDLIIEKSTGLVFEHSLSGAATRLAAAIERLLTDSSLRQSLAEQGQQHAKQFDYSEVSKKILADLATVTRKVCDGQR
jgi:glycosyltransferase involved in cell wall biosynthesis